MKTEEDNTEGQCVLCADWILNLGPPCLLLLLVELLTEVHLSGDLRYCREAAPNSFGTRDWFCGRQLCHGLGRGCGWLGGDPSTLHVLCTLFLLLLHQLHHRSSGVRSWRSGTPAIEGCSYRQHMCHRGAESKGKRVTDK